MYKLLLVLIIHLIFTNTATNFDLHKKSCKRNKQSSSPSIIIKYIVSIQLLQDTKTSSRPFEK